jgi:hypothetical protein
MGQSFDVDIRDLQQSPFERHTQVVQHLRVPRPLGHIDCNLAGLILDLPVQETRPVGPFERPPGVIVLYGAVHDPREIRIDDHLCVTDRPVEFQIHRARWKIFHAASGGATVPRPLRQERIVACGIVAESVLPIHVDCGA